MSAVELLMSACETFLAEVCFCEGDFGLKELSADWGHSGKCLRHICFHRFVP